jgi:hypothetical protein
MQSVQERILVPSGKEGLQYKLSSLALRPGFNDNSGVSLFSG